MGGSVATVSIALPDIGCCFCHLSKADGLEHLCMLTSFLDLEEFHSDSGSLMTYHRRGTLLTPGRARQARGGRPWRLVPLMGL